MADQFSAALDLLNAENRDAGHVAEAQVRATLAVAAELNALGMILSQLTYMDYSGHPKRYLRIDAVRH